MAIFLPYYFLRYCLASIVKRRNLFSDYKKRRGMSVLHDWFDWLGGFPFEVARVEEIFRFVKAKGFVLGDLVTTRSGYGNNQFLFIKE